MIDPDCDRCGEELDAPGGLVFSPPDLQGRVMKYHVCAECFKSIIITIFSGFERTESSVR